MLAELWLSVHLVGNDTRRYREGQTHSHSELVLDLDADFFLSFQKVFFVRTQWRVITAFRSRSLGARVGPNRLVLCLTCLVYVPQTRCGLWGSVTTLHQLVNTKPKPFATHCFSPSSPGSNALPPALPPVFSSLCRAPSAAAAAQINKLKKKYPWSHPQWELQGFLHEIVALSLTCGRL